MDLLSHCLRIGSTVALLLESAKQQCHALTTALHPLCDLLTRGRLALALGGVMVWLRPLYGQATSMAAQSGRSRHSCGSLSRSPWRAAPASRPRRALCLASQHAGAGSNQPQTPLQQRLVEAGVADWQAFCQPRYSTLASQPEVESMAAKIVELRREGLAAGDIEQLFQQSSSPWTSDLQRVFLPNMAYLRGLLAGESIVMAPYEPPELTPLGRLLRNQPADMGKVLTRSPGLMLELEAWLCGELGLSRKLLAQKFLQRPSIIRLSVANSEGVLNFFLAQLGMSLDQAVDLLLRYSNLYRSSPDTLARKCYEMAQVLSIPSVGALVLKDPRILTADVSRLPSMLHALDALMGQDGAGVELVLKAPILISISSLRIERAVQGLVKLGLQVEDVRELVSVYPELLLKDLEGPVQQQKLQWAQQQLGWTLAKLLRERIFEGSLCRLASRLAFMRHLGLCNPGNLRYIGQASEPVFLARVGKAAGKEISTGDFAQWVAAWLQTPEGQRWGFKPEKPKGARQPKG